MLRLHRYFGLLSISLLVLLIAACSPQPELKPGQGISLASYKDAVNGVAVAVRLEHPQTGLFLLTATFTPPAGYHLYSKDIPRNGINGQGHPTLLELPPEAKMQAAGSLTVNALDEMPGYLPTGILVYPDGPVTLTLPVRLPPGGRRWVDDMISLTYMACSETTCTAPTVGKLISLRVPALGAVQDP
jgi:hypothetical protein